MWKNSKFWWCVIILNLMVAGMYTGNVNSSENCYEFPSSYYFGGGNGTSSDPYIIEDVLDLQNMSANLTAHYILGNDLDASATAGWNNDSGVFEGFTPIGPGPWDNPTNHFTGTLDGQNYTITGLYINRTDEWYVGLFGYIGIGGKVTNLTIVNSSINGQFVVGGLSGAIETANVSNIDISGNISGTGDWIGGMIGWSWNGTVTDSHAEGLVNGTEIIGGLVGLNEGGSVDSSSFTGTVSSLWNWTGGLVGWNWMGTISNSSANAEVSGNESIGGLVGANEFGTVILSQAQGNITSTGRYVGGLVGFNNGSAVLQSYSMGNINGYFGAGGLIGYSNGLVNNSFATGNVTGIADIGGLVGNLDNGTITNSNSSGAVNGSSRIGGLIGSIYIDGHINNTYSTGNVNASTRSAGGLIGWSRYGTVLNSHSSGNVYGEERVGGLIGFVEYTYVSNTYALGNVNGSWSNHGGLVGWNRFGTIAFSHAHGNVNGLYSVGGFIGYNQGPIEDSYAMGTVNGETGVGGFVGGNGDEIIESSATGNVNARGVVGGFAGDNNGIINSSRSIGRVNGKNSVGGFVGRNFGLITISFALGNVIGRDDDVGGFVGGNTMQVYNSYSWGNVTRLSSSNDTFGGFAGNNEQAEIINCYSTGWVHDANASNPTSNGFVGNATIGGSYEMSGDFWDMQTSQQSATAGNATGESTYWMKRKSPFANSGWDFNNVWWMAENITYPLLNWQDTWAPEANAGPDQSIGRGLSVTFDGAGSTDDYCIASYSWTFQYEGNEVKLDGISPEHQFNVLGIYNVELKVTDLKGNSDWDIMTVAVRDITTPIANAGPDQDVDERTLVAFNGSMSTDDIGIVNYTWTFHDNAPVFLYGIAPDYLFKEPGTYQVTLIVRDAANNTDIDTMNLTVRDITPPTANAGPDQDATEGGTVTFNGSASTDNIGIANYTWTFNDGLENVTLYGAMPSHVFPVHGSFAATLTVRDAAGNTGTDSMSVDVAEQAILPDTEPPSAQAGPDRSVAASIEITFDGSSSTDNIGIANYTWTFIHNGSAIILYGPSPSFTFWEVGNHTVTLNISDAAGNWDTDTLVVTVTAIPPANDGAGGDYLWIAAILILCIIVWVIVLFMRRNKQPSPKVEEPQEPKVEPTPVEQKPPEPPKLQPQKPKLTKEEMLARIEKAYREGKMSEEQYLNNKEKFG